MSHTRPCRVCSMLNIAFRLNFPLFQSPIPWMVITSFKTSFRDPFHLLYCKYQVRTIFLCDRRKSEQRTHQDCMRGASLLRSLFAASPADDLTRSCPFGSHGRVNWPTFPNFSLRKSKILMHNIPKFQLKKTTNSEVIRKLVTTQIYSPHPITWRRLNRIGRWIYPTAIWWILREAFEFHGFYFQISWASI